MQIIDLFAVLALILAAWGWRRAAKLQKAVEQAVRETESLRSHITASNNILDRKIEDLRNTMRKRQDNGARRFSADMMVAEALELHPDTGAVMASFHLGGCSSCNISDDHELGPAAESYGVDVNALLAALNNLLDGGAVPAQQSRDETLLNIESDI